jgi:hypothetical protein
MISHFDSLKKGTCFKTSVSVKDSKRRLYYIILNRSPSEIHTFWIRDDSDTAENKPTYNILDFNQYSWQSGGFEDKTVAAFDYKDRRTIFRYLLSNKLARVKT